MSVDFLHGSSISGPRDHLRVEYEPRVDHIGDAAKREIKQARRDAFNRAALHIRLLGSQPEYANHKDFAELVAGKVERMGRSI